MKMIRITNTVFATDKSGISAPVYEGGKDYPVDTDSLRQVALRNGEEIEVPDPEPVPAPEVAADPAPAAEPEVAPAAEVAPAPVPKKSKAA